MPLHKAALTQRANDLVITGVEYAGAKGDICLQLVPAREGDVRTSQVIYGYAKVRVESEAGSARSCRYADWHFRAHSTVKLLRLWSTTSFESSASLWSIIILNLSHIHNRIVRSFLIQRKVYYLKIALIIWLHCSSSWGKHHSPESVKIWAINQDWLLSKCIQWRKCACSEKGYKLSWSQ